MLKNPHASVAILLATVILSTTFLMTACASENSADTTDESTSAKDTEPFNVETVVPETTEPLPTETTEPPVETMTPPETTAEPEIVEPEFVNPLTGLETDVDYSDRRPVAIMINNIEVATPQEGVSYADIMYECIVEGWQTRLMMVVSDYESLPVVGSVRSSREYYLDFAANHNAIYIHAGGSTQAYAEIESRQVDNIDGVNRTTVGNRSFYVPNVFVRDENRRQKMGYEHSLMTEGKNIASGIKYCKYDTKLKENFDSPLDFVSFGEERVPSDGDATFLKVTFSGIHKPYFKYNADEKVYYRWQFTDKPHIDNTADVQLSFTNVIVLYLPTVSTGDKYNHFDVTTTGEGEGYYLSLGGYEKITWKKTGEDQPLKLYDANGEELLVNRGKTFFQICTEKMKATTELN